MIQFIFKRKNGLRGFRPAIHEVDKDRKIFVCLKAILKFENG